MMVMMNNLRRNNHRAKKKIKEKVKNITIIKMRMMKIMMLNDTNKITAKQKNKIFN